MGPISNIVNIGAMHVHQSQNWRTLLKAPATPSKTVAFKMSAGVSEREREKFLTAKYGHSSEFRGTNCSAAHTRVEVHNINYVPIAQSLKFRDKST